MNAAYSRPRPHPLLRALAEQRWSVQSAAYELGITRQSVYARLHHRPGHADWNAEQRATWARLTGLPAEIVADLLGGRA